MSYANITVLGNVGAKPTIRSVGDTQGASFNIAVTEKYKSRTGIMKETTHWYTVDAIGNLVSAVIVPYIDKGATVLVSGFPKMDTYESKTLTSSDGKAPMLTRMKINISGFGGQLKLVSTKGKGATVEVSKTNPESIPDDDIPF
jgi:single-stranded DNA-binding protein